MVSVVVGGSGSGKSAYAEKRIKELMPAGEGHAYYLATMKVYGQEGALRVSKHRAMRQGKGFETIERTRSINRCFDDCPVEIKDRFVLLECLSNLVANEMFDTDDWISEDDLHSRILGDIKDLINKCESIVIVTNNVFEDGEDYDESTLSYMRVLAAVNNSLVTIADEAYECVAGIAIKLR